MDCKAFRQAHLAYLDDTLCGDDMAAAQRHVLQCDRCAAHDTMVRRSLLVARNLPAISPSERFELQLKARLAECRAERACTPHGTLRGERVALHAVGRSGDGQWSTTVMRRTSVAIAASAVVGALLWQADAPAPANATIQPGPSALASLSAAPQVSPAMVQAMATGNPVWPVTVIIDDVPQFLPAQYTDESAQPTSVPVGNALAHGIVGTSYSSGFVPAAMALPASFSGPGFELR
jgi:hypothetical protein